MENFTSDDLVAFMYNEVDMHQKNLIQETIIRNWPLKEKYEVMLAAKQRLQNASLLSPDPFLIRRLIAGFEKDEAVSMV